MTKIINHLAPWGRASNKKKHFTGNKLKCLVMTDHRLLYSTAVKRRRKDTLMLFQPIEFYASRVIWGK
jgi:hypothetical protein